jgi:hypothetical protein
MRRRYEIPGSLWLTCCSQVSIFRRSDYSEELVELDAYLRLEPDGPLSDQAREAQEYAKRKAVGSVVIIEAAQAKP